MSRSMPRNAPARKTATTRALHDARPVGDPEREKMHEYLSSVTLADLVAHTRAASPWQR